MNQPSSVLPIAGYSEFELDVEKILKKELPDFFDVISPAPLTAENVDTIPEGAKGAYLLLHDGQAVYAGKTDAEHGFRDRLGRHHHSVQHRIGLDPALISFKAARVMVFSNFDVEAILIKEMRRRAKGSLKWNNSGFGSNDPGRNRDFQRPAKFDRWFPIDIDRPLAFIAPGSINLLELLVKLKEGLPYDFRYETDVVGLNADGEPKYAGYRQGHAEQKAITFQVPAGPVSMRSLMVEIVGSLPGAAWQATKFPGSVILYREHQSYKYIHEIIR
jgi:hypothetical protein